ncbi:MAG: DUF928 domain-containing protein [Spirulinaceae cyanobacterium]
MGFSRNWTLRRSFRAGLLVLSTLGFGLGAIAPLPAQAVGFPSSTPSSGAPPRTASGAPRRPPSCIWAHENRDFSAKRLTTITVLAPVSNVITSLAPQPSLTFYLPQIHPLEDNNGNLQDTSEIEIELIVEEHPEIGSENFDQEFVATMPISEASLAGPRLVSYPLQDISLESGKVYRWEINVNCASPTLGSIEGWIDCRQGCNDAAVIPDPQKLSPEALAKAAQDYADQGFWHEAAQFTRYLRQAEPQQWQTLLESQGLGCFATVPFVEDEMTGSAANVDPGCFIDQDRLF